MEWSPDGEYFLTGGNENKAYVFSKKMDIPIMKMNHKAAVRALDWSHLNRNIFATGGGTADQHLRLWNLSTKELVNEIHT